MRPKLGNFQHIWLLLYENSHARIIEGRLIEIRLIEDVRYVLVPVLALHLHGGDDEYGIISIGFKNTRRATTGVLEVRTKADQGALLEF